MEGGGFECFQKFSKRNSAHFGLVIGVQAYRPSVATGLGSRRSRLNSGIGRAPCINTGRLVSRVVSLNNFSENFLRNLRLFYLNGTECSTTVLQTMIHAPPNFSLRFSTSPRRMPVVHSRKRLSPFVSWKFPRKDGGRKKKTERGKIRWAREACPQLRKIYRGERVASRRPAPKISKASFPPRRNKRGGSEEKSAAVCNINVVK